MLDTTLYSWCLEVNQYSITWKGLFVGRSTSKVPKNNQSILTLASLVCQPHNRIVLDSNPCSGKTTFKQTRGPQDCRHLLSEAADVSQIKSNQTKTIPISNGFIKSYFSGLPWSFCIDLPNFSKFLRLFFFTLKKTKQNSFKIRLIALWKFHPSFDLEFLLT